MLLLALLPLLMLPVSWTVVPDALGDDADDAAVVVLVMLDFLGSCGADPADDDG